MKKHQRRTTSLFAALLLLIAGNAAAITVDWAEDYNGPVNGTDRASKTVTDADADGNVYVTGSSAGSRGTDYLTIKYDPSGNTMWEARYAGPGYDDHARDIAVDKSGNVYVTGYSRSTGRCSSGWGMATVKYDASGIEQWVKRDDGYSCQNLAVTIALDDDGYVYIAGTSARRKQGETPGFPYWTSGYDWVTFKYDPSNGAIIWKRIYDHPRHGDDHPNDLTIDSNGNVYVVGTIGGYTHSNYLRYSDFGIVKYDANGTQLWVAQYNGPGNYADRLNAVTVDGNGNVYATGHSYGSGSGYDYATVKYNQSGVQQWVSRYNNGTDYPRSIALDANGNVYITGYSSGSGTDNDYATIKYDSNGAQQWVARYNGPGNGSDTASQIAVDSNGNSYITGGSYGSGTGQDFATIKYDTNGAQAWAERYNGTGNGDDSGGSLALDAAGNVFVTGQSHGGASGIDYLTIKYSQNQPPVADAGDDQIIECAGPDGAAVTLDGSGSSDPNNDPLTYTWSGPFGEAIGVNPSVTLPLGESEITLVVNDGTVDSAPATVTVTVQDTTPPTVELSVSPTVLWPPNHKYRDISSTITATDTCDANPSVNSVYATSNEPDNGKGDGNTVNDIVIKKGKVSLRAERSRAGEGNGRIYTILYTAVDDSGNSSSASAEVSVPKSRGKGKKKGKSKGKK